jgi:hypothetical protein
MPLDLRLQYYLLPGSQAAAWPADFRIATIITWVQSLKWISLNLTSYWFCISEETEATILQLCHFYVLKTHEALSLLFLFHCWVFSRNVSCLRNRMASKEEVHAGRFFQVATTKSCQGVSLFTCFPAMFPPACSISEPLRGGIWHSEANKQITLMCSVGLSQWLMGYQLLKSSVWGKTKLRSPMQMTREAVRTQHRVFLAVKLPPWKLLMRKAVHFASQCVDLLTCASPLLGRLWDLPVI